MIRTEITVQLAQEDTPMVGKFQIQLGAEQLMSGMSSSDFATDGALGVSSTGLNPFVIPGIIKPLAGSIDLSTNVTGNVIASAEDSQISTGSSYGRTFIDDGGNYYTYSNPSTVTKTNTATNTTNYVQGLTDMVSYNGNTYVSTADGDIDRWNTSTLTLTNSYWHGAGNLNQALMNASGIGTLPHPMLVYNSVLYIAGQNSTGAVIHGINTSATIDTFFPALPFQLLKNEIIYALGIDPLTGLMLVSVQAILNASDILSSRFFVYLWDGISAQPTRKIPVDDLITAFHNVEGSVYVGQGTTLGQWNGNGVTFLRKLLFASTTSGDLIYKHRICSTGRILHVVDGQNVLSYGSVVTGKKGFFYTTFNPSGSGHLSAIFPMGFIYQLAVAYATNKLSKFDFMDSGGGAATLYFNNIYFPRPVFIRRIRVITSGIVATSGIGQVLFFDEKNNSYTTQVSTFVVPASQSPKYVFDYDYPSAKVQAVQPRIVISNQAIGVVRVYVYYDIAE